MVIINFLDGSHLEIQADTILNGYKKTDSDKEFYLANVFTDSIDGQFSKDGSKLATVNPQIGILGFILSVDFFSVGSDTENNIVYLSTAVKSVENYHNGHIMEPVISSINIKR